MTTNAAAAAATRTSRSSDCCQMRLHAAAVMTALTINSVDRQDHFAVSYTRDGPAAATLRGGLVKWCKLVQQCTFKLCAGPAHCVLLLCTVAVAQVAAVTCTTSARALTAGQQHKPLKKLWQHDHVLMRSAECCDARKVVLLQVYYCC
jgi:hypothetical protein